MSIWNRIAGVFKSQAAAQPGMSQFERVIAGIDGGYSASGVKVTPQVARSIATVYGCTRILAYAISQSTLNMHRREGNEPGEVVLDHPLARVLEQPNSWQGPAEYWSLATSEVVLHGNHLSRKRRDSDGNLTALQPLAWLGVTPEITDLDRVLFEYRDPYTHAQETYTQGQVSHLRGLPDARGFLGISALRSGHETLGIAVAQRSYSGETMRNGAMPSGVFTNDSNLSDDAYRRLKASVQERYTGLVNAGRPMLLEEGLSFTPLSMSPADAELIASMKYTREQIAEFFGVPAALLSSTDGTTQWGSGVEQIFIGFVRLTVRPLGHLLADGLARSCLTPTERREFTLSWNFDSLLAGDFKTSQEGLAIMRSHAIITANEWRRRMRMTPADAPGMDDYTPAANLYGQPGQTSEGNDDAAV